MPDQKADFSSEYESLFNTCVIDNNRFAEIDAVISKMLANKSTYDDVADKLKIPWYFIAIIHCMEGSLSFKKHLHNGDSLEAKTIQVPKGRPLAGQPPFSWEDSAVDALTMEGFLVNTDWSITGMLYLFEKYNGMGYRKRGIHSPYLWSFSNHYTSGKFTVDGSFDPNAISKQVGAAVLLRRMSEKQVAIKGEVDTISIIKSVGAQVKFDPKNVQEKASQLQQLLNSVGLHLRVDGIAGKNTSDAFFSISGTHLQGDNR